MKKLKIIILAILFFTITPDLFAQSKTQPKPLIIETMHINPVESTFRVNMDSLVKIWKERILDPNPYLVSVKIGRHWFGSDSRDIVYIYELKSWDDIQPAFKKQNELIKAHKGWVNDEDFKAFRKLWFSVFVNNAYHSDEIYQVME